MSTLAEQQAQKPEPEHYSFILFVITDGANSAQARENLERLCAKWLPERHTITVVDVHNDFQTALDYNIMVTPSVVITSTKPKITIHGDLSDTNKILNALDLQKGANDDS